MKHLPDLLTLRHRCLLFRSSVRSSLRPSVNSSVMSKFDIHVKVSILINNKTKQQSNLAWNISLTTWRRHPLFRSSIRPSVCPSVSTFISKFDMYIKVSILINYTSTTTIIPCMTQAGTLTNDLDLYFALQWLWHNLGWRSRSSQL